MTDSGAVAGRPDVRAGRAQGRLSADAQAWAIIATMVALAAVCLALMPWPSEALRPISWWIVLPLIAAHAWFERTVFYVQIGDQAHAFSLSEIPTAFAIVFLSPVAALAVRLAGSVPVAVGVRRNRGVKLAFNVMLYVAETVIAIVVARVLVRWWGESDSALLLAVMIGIVLGSITSGFALAGVVSRYEGRFVERFRDQVVAQWWWYSVGGVFAVMAVSLSLVEPWLGVVAVLPAVGLWTVLRRFGALVQELDDLDALHGFAGRVGGTLDPDEIGERAVADIVELIRADGAALLRAGGDSITTHVAGHVPIRLPKDIDDERWRYLVGHRGAAVLPVDGLRELGAVTDDRLKRVMIAPVLDDDDSVALLIATERNIQRMWFAEPELSRFRNMAAQLAVSLRRGLLHDRLEYEARHDALTGLPARTLFELAVADALVSPNRSEVAVMMLDLDRFKEVNDTLGHHAGDALLVEFSRRMSALLEPGDLLARLAGDEFAIVCRRSSPDEIVQLAERCVEAGGSPVVLDGLEIVVTVSCGVALVHDGETDPLQPMRRADIAMYNAKWQRTSVELYRDEIDRRTPARLSMLGDLRAAIEQDEIDVVYQPKLDLRTREIVGVEALVRWHSPTRGVVAPSEFVRVAEDTGLIKELTDLVLEQGIAALRSFDELGLGLQMSINLSTHDLFDTKLPERVRTRLDRQGVPADRLTLEITESSLLVDAPRTRATIDELHRAGFRLAVDDFGTGYSSLSYLRRLPVQELKIDQSFVSGMSSDPQDEVIVKSTVDLGRNLRLLVVAEGVEDEATLEALTRMGCDVAQGYGIARPLPLQELIEWVGRTRNGAERRARIGSDVEP